jgi:outer membrane protein assembly factor BamA
MRFHITRLLAILTIFGCFYQQTAGAEAIACDTISHHNFIEKLIDYFDDSNKVHNEKDFDLSFIGGPHYSSDTKLGIGLVASGIYRKDKGDSIIPPSNVSLYFDGTTSKSFKLGVTGTNISKGDKYRINYDLDFSSVATQFWGIGYEQCYKDANESNYDYFKISLLTNLSYRIGKHFYVGPLAAVNYVCGRDFVKPELWNGQDNHSLNLGLGMTMTYDTRDNLTGATRGVYVNISQCFNAKIFANKYAFSMSEVKMSTYNRLWKDAVLASLIHARITYGDTPWGMMSILGGSNMRGYFEGRYRDKSEADFCVELRQHIWHRSGLTVWGGAGTIFSKLSDITLSTTLPNYGFGYRWEFKQNVNVRLDLGFGRNQTGFIFNINEAF